MDKNGHKLLSVEREKLILKLLGKGYTTITELSGRIDVSEATIRRDLLSLEEAKKVRRVHGGAVKVENTETEVETYSVNPDVYSVRFIGPGLNTTIEITEDYDLLIVAD